MGHWFQQASATAQSHLLHSGYTNTVTMVAKMEIDHRLIKHKLVSMGYHSLMLIQVLPLVFLQSAIHRGKHWLCASLFHEVTINVIDWKLRKLFGIYKHILNPSLLFSLQVFSHHYYLRNYWVLTPYMELYIQWDYMCNFLGIEIAFYFK